MRPVSFAAAVLIGASLLPVDAAAQAEQQCVACHGANGEGNAQMNAPRIAGQPQAYLERQLEAYASGARQNPVMAPIAKGLSAAQRREAARHYAQIANSPRASARASTTPRARQLATRGDEKLRVQACENCHGPGGTGLGAFNPFIAGLDPKYLQSALSEWRSGARKTDPSGQMPRIAAALSATDVQALAQYYGSLPSPQYAGRTTASTQAKAGRATPSATGAGREPTQGTGVQGGETTQGGSQGPGGGGAASGTGPSGSRTGGTSER
jgi:cytochrome c553